MRVFYDYQAFLQKYGGVSRYFISIINEFKKNNMIDPILPVYYSENMYYPYKKTFLPFSFKGKIKILTYLNKRISTSILESNEFDLFHPTYFDTYFLKYYKKDYIITIHDMIHELFPSLLSDKKTKNNKYLVSKKAKKIIAVSENTKKDILQLYPEITENKITVIYHATSLSYDNSPPSITVPYILYVGERHSYKNFLFFISSIANILDKEDIYLVCAGGPPFNNKEKEFMIKKNIIHRIKYMPIFSDNQLANLYHHALLFCYPSLYEGFGIPILEAFACRCPVVLSNTSCFPEIAQDCAAYFDPTNQDSIRETITFVLNNTSYREILKEKAIKRLAFFSWEKSACQTFRVYQETI